MTSVANGSGALPPGSTLGVVGGGQLGRYFALAARRLGFVTAVLDPDASAPAVAVADVAEIAGYDDHAALARLADRCDAITIEFENVPAASLAFLEARTRLVPGAAAVAVAQHRALEKREATRLGLEPVPWRTIETLADVRELVQAEVTTPIGPSILKTATLGYDGRGQWRCDDADAVGRAFESAGRAPCVLETRVGLLAELSVVLARGHDGATQAFDPVLNVHENGILHTSTVPSRLVGALERDAVDAAARLADGIGYVGVLAVEFFVVAGEEGAPDRLLFNEMAPRPHNSGHWTLDACTVSQFEQQVRALAGLPLARPRTLSPVTMLNVLGDCWSEREPPFAEALTLHGAVLHLYGKAQPRPGRKMGHVNCVADTTSAARALAERAHALLTGSTGGRG